MYVYDSKVRYMHTCITYSHIYSLIIFESNRVSLSWGVVMLNKAVNWKAFAFILLFLWKLFESYIIISDILKVPLRFFA